MTVTAIAAVADNGVIGIHNRLPWHLPADLAHFKRLTHGHHLIVGRRTWESVGKPLPGRVFVVVSRSPAPPGRETFWVPTVAEAIAAARRSGDGQPFLAGGTGVFREGFEMDLVDRIELTRVHAEPEGDTRFPEFDMRRFREVARIERPADERNAFPMTFLTLERQRS
jgi:dihydrofolate reductase